MAVHAGVLLALILSLVMPVGAFRPAPAQAAPGVVVSLNVDVPSISLGDSLEGSWSFTEPYDAAWTATVDYGEGGITSLGAVEPDTAYLLSYTYTSAGDKTLTVEVSDGTLTGENSVTVTVGVPDIVPESPSVNDGIPVSPGQAVVVAWNDANAGSGDILAWTTWNDQIWLSGDAALDTGVDTLLQDVPIEAIERTGYGGWLYVSMTVTIPGGLEPGTYSMFVIADAFGTVTETDEGNNIASVAFTVGSTANTAPVANAGGPYTAVVGEWFPLYGSGSYDPDGDPLLDYAWDIDYDGITFNPTYYGAYPMVSYGTVGTYTVALQVRDNRMLASEIVTTTVAVNVPLPDLVPNPGFVSPAQVDPGNTVYVDCWNINQGTGTIAAGTSWTQEAYLSTDTTISLENDVYLGAVLVSIPEDLWPYNGADASFEVTIPAETDLGDYYILVRTDSGNSVEELNEDNNVSSIRLKIGVPLYDLVIESVTTGVATAKLGDQVTVNWVGRNDGAETVTGAWWYDEIYLSTDTMFDGDDTNIGWQDEGATLEPGGTYPSSRDVTIPMWVSPGTYYILVYADRWDYLPETDQTNNVLASGPLTISSPSLDLEPVSIGTIPTTVAWGDQFTIDVEVKNNGPDDIPSSGSWSTRLYLSADDTFDPADDPEFAYRLEDGPLAAGTTRTSTIYVWVSDRIAGGTYTLFLVADGSNRLAETEEGNNVLMASTRLTIDAPDYDLEAVSIGATVTEARIGDTLSITWSEASVGSDAIPENMTWYDTVHLRSDSTGDAGDVYVLDRQHDISMFVDGQGTFSADVPLYPEIEPGTYYLLLKVDRYGYVPETLETNNMLVSGPITITAPAIDLVPVSIDTAATSVEIGDMFGVTLSMKNAGPDAVPGGMGWTDAVFLSADERFDRAEDVRLGWFWRSSTMLVDEALTRGETCRVPTWESPPAGTYHLLFVVDFASSIAETNEDNNVLVGPMIEVRERVTDLVPDTVSFTPASAVPGDLVTVTWSVRNDGTSSTTRGWMDWIYLSADPVLDASDARALIAYTSEGSTNEYAFRVPLMVADGDYYVILQVDYYNNITETNEDNNVLVADDQLAISGGFAVDLEPISSTVDPVEGVADGLVSVTYTVVNNGPDALPADVGHEDMVMFSRDEVLDSDDLYIASSRLFDAVDVDATYTRTLTGWVPWNAEPGPSYLILIVNNTYDIVDIDQSNNIVVIPFTVLEPVTNTAPVVVINHADSITLGDTFESDGTVVDPDPGDTLAATVNYGDGTIDDLPIVDSVFNLSHVYATAGTFIVTVTVSDGTDTGSDEVSVTVNVPDITITVYHVNDGIPVAPGDPAGIYWDDTNAGPGAILEGTTWTDAVYLSTDATFDAGDTWLADYAVPPVNHTPPGYSIACGTSVTLPEGMEPGEYVIIVVADAHGALVEANEENNVGTLTLTVAGPNTLPMVTLGDDATVDEGNSFTRTGSFTDPDVGDAHTATVDYGEGDGPVPLALQADKTFTLDHTYMDNGTYDVTVVVSDGREGAGLAPAPVGGSATVRVTVNNVAPAVDRIDAVTLVAGQALEQTVTFSDPGADDWAVEVDYDGDDVVDETGMATLDRTYGLNHVYGTAGTFTVTVTVTDDDGGVDNGQFTVTVNDAEANVAPVVGTIIAAPANPAANGVVQVTAPFTDANTGDTHTATVNWGDGSGSDAMTVAESSGSGTATASHRYATKGKYTITVTVSDRDLSGTATLGIRVTPAPAANTAPVAVPGGPYAVIVGDTLTLDGSGSYDPNNNLPLTWEWDTNYSGTFSTDLTGMTPVTSYTDAGTYTVALRVTDSLGLASTVATTTVTVTATAPNVAPVVGPVTVTPSKVVANTAVQVSAPFTDGNTADTHMVNIDWGDGTATGWYAATSPVSASHTYAAKGKYTITVTVSDGALSGSASAAVQVLQPPKPSKETTTIESGQAPVIPEPTPVPTPMPTVAPEPTTVPTPTVAPEPTPLPETPTVTVEEVPSPTGTDADGGQ